MNKVKKYIDRLYKKACNYRDKKGYRENLGYDKESQFSSYMCKFNLTYKQECELKDYFYYKMDNV